MFNYAYRIYRCCLMILPLASVSAANSQPSTLDAMSSPSKITTQPNSAYAPIVPFQTHSTPAVSTNTNVAYSVLPTTHSNSEYEIVL